MQRYKCKTNANEPGQLVNHVLHITQVGFRRETAFRRELKKMEKVSLLLVYVE